MPVYVIGYKYMEVGRDAKRWKISNSISRANAHRTFLKITSWKTSMVSCMTFRLRCIEPGARKVIRSGDQQCGRRNDVRRIGVSRSLSTQTRVKKWRKEKQDVYIPVLLPTFLYVPYIDQTMFKRGRNCYTTLRQNFSVSRAGLQNKKKHLTQHNNFTGIIFDVYRYSRDIFSTYITYILLHYIFM